MFECSGRGEAAEAGLDQLDYAGTFVFVGTSMTYPRVNHNRAIILESTILGAYNYDAAGFAPALELLASGKMPLDELIEPVDVLLDGLYDVMQRCARGELPGKVMIRPEVSEPEVIRGGDIVKAEPEYRPRLNHVAITMDPAALDDAGRAEILDFYGDVFGWTEGDNTGERGNPLILYTGEFGQFIFLLPSEGAATGSTVDHFGLQVSTCEEIEDIVARAKKRQASDDRVTRDRHPLAHDPRTRARVHAHQRVHRLRAAAHHRAAEHHPAGHMSDVDDAVLFERDGYVGLITLNRPERLNAINTAMIADLSDVLLRADQDRNVRVIILTGAGRGFCSGLDLQAVADGSMGVGEGGSTSGVADRRAPAVRAAPHRHARDLRAERPRVRVRHGPRAGLRLHHRVGDGDVRLAGEAQPRSREWRHVAAAAADRLAEGV